MVIDLIVPIRSNIRSKSYQFARVDFARLIFGRSNHSIQIMFVVLPLLRRPAADHHHLCTDTTLDLIIFTHFVDAKIGAFTCCVNNGNYIHIYIYRSTAGVSRDE